MPLKQYLLHGYKARKDPTRHAPAWHTPARHDLGRPGTPRHGMASPGMAWVGPALYVKKEIYTSYLLLRPLLHLHHWDVRTNWLNAG